MTSVNRYGKPSVTHGFERADCAVRAVSNSTGVDYDTVHAAFAKCGRKNNCRTKWGTEFIVLRLLGFEAIAESTKAKTVRTIEKELMPGRNYMVETRGHYLSVVDGVVQDWTQGRQHRVRKVWWIRRK